MLDSATDSIQIAFDTTVTDTDDPTVWQFAKLNLGARHCAALAIRRGVGPDLKLFTNAFDSGLSAPLNKGDDLAINNGACI